MSLHRKQNMAMAPSIGSWHQITGWHFIGPHVQQLSFWPTGVVSHVMPRTNHAARSRQQQVVKKTAKRVVKKTAMKVAKKPAKKAKKAE